MKGKFSISAILFLVWLDKDFRYDKYNFSEALTWFKKL